MEKFIAQAEQAEEEGAYPRDAADSEDEEQALALMYGEISDDKDEEVGDEEDDSLEDLELGDLGQGGFGDQQEGKTSFLILAILLLHFDFLGQLQHLNYRLWPQNPNFVIQFLSCCIDIC